MTDKELAEIRARCEAAQSGPWSVPAEESTDYYCGGWEVEHERSKETFSNVAQMIDSKADADFIAHAREDMPKLLAEVERRFTEAEVRELLRLIDWDGYLAPEARNGKSGLFDADALLAHLKGKR